MALSVTLSHDTAAFERLRAEWEALQAISTADSIYLTWDWITLWWQHFGAGRELWLLEARDEAGQLVGLGPMMRSAHAPLRGLRWQQVEFIGAPSPCEHLDFLARPGDEEAVTRAFVQRLIAEQPRWDVLSVTRLPEYSPTLGILRAWPGIAWEEDVLIAPVIALPNDWDTYFMSLSEKKRYSQRRLRRILDAEYPDGGWQWQRITDPNEIAPTLNELIAAHQAWWTGLGQAGAFAGPYTPFFHALAPQFARRGWLELSRVDLKGQFGGAFYGYNYRGRFYDFAHGVNMAYSELQIGHMLVEMTLRHLIDQGAREYDFLWGTEEYKYRWGAKDRQDITLIWRASRRARLIHATVEGLRAAWGRVKRVMPASLRDRIKAAVRKE